MKYRAFILAPALTAWLLVATITPAARIHRDAVEGIQTASSENEGLKLLLNAEGDLPGQNSLILLREGNAVTDGTWTLTVMPPDAGPTTNEKGKLTGKVTGGTLTFNSDGALTGADSLQLTIQSGTGQYASHKSGSGSITLASRAENPSQLVGTLTLDF